MRLYREADVFSASWREMYKTREDQLRLTSQTITLKAALGLYSSKGKTV